MMKKYLLILLFLPFEAVAQSPNLDSAKFELIKETVRFFLTDPIAFPDVPPTAINVSCKTGDYPCLIKFAKDNQLKLVDIKVETWGKEKVKNAKDIEQLRDRIITELTDSTDKNKNKSYRTRMAAYPGYLVNMNKVVSAVMQNPAGDQSDNVALKTDTIGGSTNGNGNKVKSVTDNSGNILTWVALFLGLGGLGLAGWLFTRMNKLEANFKAATANSQVNENTDTDRVESKLKGLETQIGQKADSIALTALQEKMAKLENNLNEQVKQSEPPPPTSAPATPSTNKTTTATFYAKFADPDGFTLESLKSDQNGERIFEILVQGEDTATFSISNHSGAQAYAIGSGANHILENACTLYNQPRPNCRIQTREPGSLQKRGDVWQIERKAVVEFA